MTTSQDLEAWKIAGISFDTTIDNNVISKQLVLGVLFLQDEVHSNQKEGLTRLILADGQEVHIDGFIELTWSFEKLRKTFTSTFLVSPTDDFDFDVILGRRTI